MGPALRAGLSSSISIALTHQNRIQSRTQSGSQPPILVAELDAVSISRTFAAQMVQTFEFDATESEPIDLAAWQNRPWRDRWKEKFFHRTGRLL